MVAKADGRRLAVARLPALRPGLARLPRLALRTRFSLRFRLPGLLCGSLRPLAALGSAVGTLFARLALCGALLRGSSML